MRKSVLAGSALAALLLAVSTLAFAQFQPTTQEELKMTADPQAPGAAAVYLYREEITDDAQHFHSYYVRLKVLTEKGQETATVSIPYEHSKFEVTAIQGRTIHVDGTVIPLATKPSDLLDTKNAGRPFNQMVFTLPGVEVGSILEYRLQLRDDSKLFSSPTWIVQQPFFVHKAHYSFNPPTPEAQTWLPSKLTTSGTRYSTTTPISRGQWYSKSNDRSHSAGQILYRTNQIAPEKVVHSDKGAYSLDVSDIPPAPHEAWMPPLDTILWKVKFYLSYTDSGPEFWDEEQKQWAKEVDHLTNPTALLKSAVGAMISSTDSEELKARKIYAAVMKLKNDDFIQQNAKPVSEYGAQKNLKGAEDTWKQQEGSSNELALLFVALANAAGLKAWPMQVVNRDTSTLDVRFLNMDQLQDFIAIIELGGKELYLDPGQEMCGFASLHWKHSLASGIRLSGKGATLETTPASTYKDAKMQRTGSLDIDSSGNVTGSLRVILSGQEALYWRQLALVTEPDDFRRKFDASLSEVVPDGVQVHLDHFLALNDAEANLMGIVNVSGKLGAKSDKNLLLPALFFASHPTQPFMPQKERTTAVDLHYARMEQDDVTYHLPVGYRVEGKLESTEVNWPNHALLRINSVAKDGSVEVARALVRSFTLLDARDYVDLRGFYGKVDSADQTQLVLVSDAKVAGVK
jgi:hypothetical protein